MKTNENRAFQWSWRIKDDWLPPYHLFPLVEFIFKVMQWAAFTAAIKYAANELGNQSLLLVANLLNLLLVFIISERVTRAIGGRFQPNPKLKVQAGLLVIVVIMGMAAYASFKLSSLFNEVFDQFIDVAKMAKPHVSAPPPVHSP